MNIERPDSCPKEGQIAAFDAGWNAHEVGLSRTTTEMFSPSEYAAKWALVAWDVREELSKREKNVDNT